MKINPINIYVNDIELFTSIALIVDRPDFLDDLVDLRKELNIKSFYDKIELVSILVGIFLSQKNLTKNLKFHKDITLSDVNKTHKAYSYFLAVDYLKNKYKLSTFYYPILLQALLGNKVYGTIYPSGYPLALISKNKNDKKNIEDILISEIDNFNDPKGAIIVNNWTKQSDIIKMFKTLKKEILNSIDYHPNIKRNRNWYWQNNQGKSAEKIWKDLKTHISQKAVEKGIAEYKKLIQK